MSGFLSAALGFTNHPCRVSDNPVPLPLSASKASRTSAIVGRNFSLEGKPFLGSQTRFTISRGRLKKFAAIPLQTCSDRSPAGRIKPHEPALRSRLPSRGHRTAAFAATASKTASASATDTPRGARLPVEIKRLDCLFVLSESVDEVRPLCNKGFSG